MISLLIFLYLLSLCFCYDYSPTITSSNKRYIWDLWGGTIDINGNAQDWTYSSILSSATSLTTSCNSELFLGGPDVFSGKATLEKTYSELPSHNFVYYSFSIIAVDTWLDSDKFSIIIDGTTVSEWTPASYMETYGSTSVCGSTDKDLIMTIVGKRSHSKASLTLKIVSESESEGAIAINNVVLSFPSTNIIDTVDSSNICFRQGCLVGNGEEGTIVVPASSYLDGSLSTTEFCHESCSGCFGSGSDQCYKCVPKTYSFDGENCIKCPQNCFQCSDSLTCTRCLANFVLDSDGTCKQKCSKETDIEMGNSLGTRVCTAAPCSPQEYIRWDYTCQSSCSSPPMDPSEKNSLLYCQYPCSYLQYLYDNGTCGDSCSFPYKKRIDSGTKYCEIPCGEKEFVYEDGSCEAKCASYMITVDYYQDDITICLSQTIDQADKDQIENKMRDFKYMEKMTSVVTKIASIISPSNPTYITTGLLYQMLSYIRYMNITRSGRLEVFWAEQEPRADGIFPNAGFANRLKDHFENTELPYMFTKYDVQSNFIANYADSLFLLLIYSGVAFVLYLLIWLLRVVRNIPKIRGFMKFAKIILLNYFIGQIYMRSGEIVFYAAVSFRFVALNEGNKTLSFLAALCCLCGGIFLFLIHWYLLHQYHKQSGVNNHTKGKIKNEKFIKENQGTQILYGSFKDESKISQGFLFFAALRIIIFASVTALLFDYPLFQIFFTLILNLLFLGFILIKKPFISMIEFIQQIVYEVIVLGVNLCYLILAIFDAREQSLSPDVHRLSEAILNMILICSFIPVILLGIRGLETGWIWHRRMALKRVYVHDERTTLSLQPSLSSSTMVAIPEVEEEKVKVDDAAAEIQEKEEVQNEGEEITIKNEEEVKNIDIENKSEISFVSQIMTDRSGMETERDLLSKKITPKIEVDMPYSLSQSYTQKDFNRQKFLKRMVENSVWKSQNMVSGDQILENSRMSSLDGSKMNLDKSKLNFEWILEDIGNGGKLLEVKKFKK